jgi:superfamily I DNA/RNA helicase
MFLNMEDMFPGTKKLFLATNYRSSKELVQFLREIGPVRDLADKFTTPNGSGPDVSIRGFLTAANEAAWVVSQVKENN